MVDLLCLPGMVCDDQFYFRVGEVIPVSIQDQDPPAR